MLTLASWNVNSLAARAEHVQRYLDERRPDVLMVQEVKGQGPLPEFAGYTAASITQKAYNGVAIFSKAPMMMIQNGLYADDEAARYLEVALTDGMHLINIYAPNGNGEGKFAYKLEWLAHLYARVNVLRAAGTPCIIGGDFNVIPEDVDCYDASAWVGDALFAPQAKAAYRALLYTGMTDAYRALHTDTAYTWWSYKGGAFAADRGARIDHFLVSPSLADKLISCEIDSHVRGWDRPSDHAPIRIGVQL